MRDLAVLKSDGISPAALAFPLERPLSKAGRPLGMGSGGTGLYKYSIFSPRNQEGRKQLWQKGQGTREVPRQDLARGSEGEPSLQNSLRSL